MWPNLIQALSLLYPIIAVVTLLVAPIAMGVAKGGKLHRIAGKVFFYGMCIASSSMVITSVWHGKYILALISIFGMHLIASGYRALYMKRVHRGQKPGIWDKLVQGSALLVNLGLLIWGLAMALLKVKGSNAFIYIAFGVVGAFYAFNQLRKFYQLDIDKRQWFYDHMIGFIAGYIAGLTAFSAAVLTEHTSMSEVVAYSWPTFICAPFLFLLVKRYKKRLRSGEKLRTMVESLKIRPGKD